MTKKPTPGNKKQSNSNKTIGSYQKSVRTTQPPALKKKEASTTPIYLKFVYGFMLLLMVLGGIGRFAGRSRQASNPNPAAQDSAGSPGLAAKALTFHHENTDQSVCDNLIITVGGDAVLSSCNNEGEYQYKLTENEQRILGIWLAQFKPFASQQNGQEQVSFNGHGTETTSASDVQSIIAFASEIEIEIQRSH